MSHVDDLEVPRWRKMGDSNVSHSSRKSKHKHIYIDCLIYCKEDERYYKGTVCKICNKVGKAECLWNENLEPYVDLPMYRIFSYFDKTAVSPDVFNRPEG